MGKNSHGVSPKKIRKHPHKTAKRLATKLANKVAPKKANTTNKSKKA